MPIVSHQQHRDMAIYRAWVDGARRSDLAEQYHVTRGAISRSIDRAVANMDPLEKAQEIRRAADLCDDMMATFLPKARGQNTSASREARGWLQLKLAWLGINRREVHIEHDGTIDHRVTYQPGPTVAEAMAEIMEDYRKQGVIQAQAKRMDQ